MIRCPECGKTTCTESCPGWALPETETTLVHPDAQDAPENVELIEALSDLGHRQWGHWTAYLLRILRPHMSTTHAAGCATFTEVVVVGPGYSERLQAARAVAAAAACSCGLDAATAAIGRWLRQIKTPYSDLSETEKDSDRVWARAVLALVNEELREREATAAAILLVESDRADALAIKLRDLRAGR